MGQDCFKYGPSKTWISGQNIIETHSNLRLLKNQILRKDVRIKGLCEFHTIFLAANGMTNLNDINNIVSASGGEM